jgi:hypothetical protein
MNNVNYKICLKILVVKNFLTIIQINILII